ncbi:hypothetical protein T06_3656 [Trichinella sp. T6]|nr:hypothetical protein T06_3656 [Trichinella sp. T6]
MVVGVRCVVRVQGRFPYNEVDIHLKTQEWKMNVNDRKTAISLTCGGVFSLSEYLCCGISCQVVYILAEFVFDNLYQSRSISELSNSPD